MPCDGYLDGPATLTFLSQKKAEMIHHDTPACWFHWPTVLPLAVTSTTITVAVASISTAIHSDQTTSQPAVVACTHFMSLLNDL
jgi:hypothetical protein